LWTAPPGGKGGTHRSGSGFTCGAGAGPQGPLPPGDLQDSAVVGEAAALGIGMVMLGSADKAVCDELMQYGQAWPGRLPH